MLNYFPQYFTSKSISLYFIALIASSLVYLSFTLDLVWIVFGVVEVVAFFYFSQTLTRKWSKFSPRRFVRNIFWTAFIIRVCYAVFSYFFYEYMTGKPFEFWAGDALFYDNMGQFGSSLIANGNFRFMKEMGNYSGGAALSDIGYPIYLSFIYFITGNSIFLTRLIKAVWGAWTCVFIYRLAVRNFGESVGRIAAIFTMLMPNLIMYCGIHVKEVEMVFLTVAFVERADYVLRSKKFTFVTIAVPFLLALSLFTFRTVLGATAIFSLLTALLFSSEKILGFGQRVIVTAWLVATVAYFIGGKIASEVEQTWLNRKKTQRTSMEWRSTREGGNKYAKAAGAAVFAPMIFIIPIPTMVQSPTQENQMMFNGGNFVKEILAFFLLFGFVVIVMNGNWRDYTLIGAFMLGYLLVIAFSPFAQAERFHQPALPFILMFAAWGVGNVNNKVKGYFYLYMIFLVFVILFWGWFKLSGKGMIA